MHTVAVHNMHNMQTIWAQIHNVLNVCERDVPSVSYDHREFIDCGRVLLLNCSQSNVSS